MRLRSGRSDGSRFEGALALAKAVVALLFIAALVFPKCAPLAFVVWALVSALELAAARRRRDIRWAFVAMGLVAAVVWYLRDTAR
jgi:hypothetical protein